MSAHPAPSSATTWTVSILVTLLIYLLSPHPVLRLMIATYGFSPPERITNAFEIVYTPLIVATEHVEPLKHFYQWYGGLWGFPQH
jgi:hypothetical protein